MHRLNQAATFAATIVLTVFGLTCWLLEGRPFDPPAKAGQMERAAQTAKLVDSFGGMFGVRGPHSLRASAEGKGIPRDYESLVPVSAVPR